jgi:uncharacterized protein
VSLQQAEVPVLYAEPQPAPHRRARAIEIFGVVAILAYLGRPWIVSAFTAPAAATWVTIFVAVVIQALPFVVLGTLVSAAIAVLVPPGFFAKALPKRALLAVPIAGLAGAALPGCECASVPIAGALVRRGVTPAAALAFLLSAPAINPIVLAATSVAFPGHPSMVLGRLIASLITSVVMGWIWLRTGRDDLLRIPEPGHGADAGRAGAFLASMRHDLTQAGGFLVIGAAGAASLNVLVPQHWLHAVASHRIASIAVMSFLAVVLSICSEADAFVAASLTQFSLTARLAFLVVGPMVDMKLFAMQVGAFGRRFAIRFAPTTFAVAALVASIVGAGLWGLA